MAWFPWRQVDLSPLTVSKAYDALLERAGWVFLGLAGFAFVLSGVSPVWRFHRSARCRELALRTLFGASP